MTFIVAISPLHSEADKYESFRGNRDYWDGWRSGRLDEVEQIEELAQRKGMMVVGALRTKTEIKQFAHEMSQPKKSRKPNQDNTKFPTE